MSLTIIRQRVAVVCAAAGFDVNWLRRRRDSGIAAVEFALILPVLMTMLFGIIQMASVFFTHSNMTTVARDTARRLAVGEFTVAQAEAAATANLIDWASGAATATARVPDPAVSADTDVQVQITVPIAQAGIIDLAFDFSGDLVVLATYREE